MVVVDGGELWIHGRRARENENGPRPGDRIVPDRIGLGLGLGSEGWAKHAEGP